MVEHIKSFPVSCQGIVIVVLVAQQAALHNLFDSTFVFPVLAENLNLVMPHKMAVNPSLDS